MNNKCNVIVAANGCGYSQRSRQIGVFEREIIRHCSRKVQQVHQVPPMIVEIGGGSGALATKIVESGARVYFVDCSDKLNDAAREQAAKGRIRTLFKSAELITTKDMPREVNVLCALRVLHWMKYEDVVKLLKSMAKIMPSGAQLFCSVASFSGVMSLGYPFDEKVPLASRYGIAADAPEEFCHHPVTLYRPDEIVHTLSKCGFYATRVHLTHFGLSNIRATRQDKNLGFFRPTMS